MSRYFLIVPCTVLIFCSAAAFAADNQTPTSPPEPGKDAAPAFSPKNTFRNICGFCHENYGRKAGKGPQLMGTQMTDQQIFDRIKHGKPGRMAAFGGNFTDDQINQLVAFIRGLRPDVDP
jgi:mono/diheme cytochrome c family protein